MKEEHAELFTRLEEFSFDLDEAEMTFADRLARENGWTAAHARRVVEEYRRFLFLALTAGHPVTPSDAVDQAWHLHMTYTRSYWERLCGQTLGQPLHHDPTRGGAAEASKFVRWYRRTLHSYRVAFGEEPPADIWPAPGIRFGTDLHFQRVNTQETIILPRRAIRRSILLIVVALLAVSWLASGFNPFRLPGPAFLGFYGLSLLVALVLAHHLRRVLSRPDDQPTDEADELTSFEIAYLAGGKSAAIHAGVASAAARGALAGEGRSLREARPLPPQGDPLEEAIVTAIRAGHAPDSLGWRWGIVASLVSHWEMRLRERGLLVSTARGLVVRLVTAVPLFAVFLLGVTRLHIGLAKDRPVGILSVLVLITLLLCLVALVRRPFRTRRADRLLNRLRGEQAALMRIRDHSAAPATVALGVALFGTACLEGSPLAFVSTALQPVHTGGGDGGGGGCGGGGCGGGCGGCGGCGG